MRDAAPFQDTGGTARAVQLVADDLQPQDRPDALAPGFPGVFVPIADTVRSFKAIVAGEYDHLPEAAFYMVGTIEEAVKKAESMKANA